MARTFGYGRVSRDQQTSENQQLVMEKELKMKFDVWYEDHATSGKTKAADRPNFSKMLAEAQAGDKIVFSRVDRIGRRTSDILVTVEGLLARGVEVYILQIGKEPLNTPMGKVILGVFAIFAENERDSILERTRDGLERAKKEGKVLGAKLVMHPEVLEACVKGRKAGRTLQCLSGEFNIPKNTIARNVKVWGTKQNEYSAQWAKREVQYNQARTPLNKA